jgi:hypothetical protein
MEKKEMIMQFQLQNVKSRPFGKYKRRQEDNIKMYIRELGCEFF